MTKACVSFLPRYYAFNFIRCIKFKYCVFTFKLYYLRRKKKKNQLSVFHAAVQVSVQVKINDMQPNPELVDQPLSCLTGPSQARRVFLMEEKAPSRVSDVWCSTITGDPGLGQDHSGSSHGIIQTGPFPRPDGSTDSWQGTF